MTNETSESPPVVGLPFSEIGSIIAPFIYFDGVSNFGFNGGVANITLEAVRYTTVADNKIAAERVVVAHLRMGGPAMAALKKAIEGIELLANPAQGSKVN
jgi:hypothetical protein